MQALYNGFGGGSLHGTNQSSNQPQHFHHPQARLVFALFFIQRMKHHEPTDSEFSIYKTLME